MFSQREGAQRRAALKLQELSRKMTTKSEIHKLLKKNADAVNNAAGDDDDDDNNYYHPATKTGGGGGGSTWVLPTPLLLLSTPSVRPEKRTAAWSQRTKV